MKANFYHEGHEEHEGKFRLSKFLWRFVPLGSTGAHSFHRAKTLRTLSKDSLSLGTLGALREKSFFVSFVPSW
jgi:hypothetical protein